MFFQERIFPWVLEIDVVRGVFVNPLLIPFFTVLISVLTIKQGYFPLKPLKIFLFHVHRAWIPIWGQAS